MAYQASLTCTSSRILPLSSFPFFSPDAATPTPPPTPSPIPRIPHVMPFANDSHLDGMFQWIKHTYPFWNETVAKNETRHIMVFSCDHGAGAAGPGFRDSGRGHL